MPKGVKGFPVLKGKTSNRANGMPFTNVINRALKQWKKGDPNSPNALRKIADELIECAMDPTNDHYEFAVKQIGDRIDGTPKRGDTQDAEVAAELLLGISGAFAALSDFNARSKEVHGETIVQDRPVLSAEVCAEEGGHGEGVAVSEVSGHSE